MQREVRHPRMPPWIPPSSQLRRWGWRSFATLLDQGLISGSNFVLSVLLARWIAPVDYGAYGLAFATFLLLANIYQALILEPMSVYGPAIYAEKPRSYLGALFWLQAALLLPIALLIATAALVTWVVSPGSPLVSALAGVAVGAPLVLLFWFARRAFYLESAPHRAVMGAILYCVVMIPGIYLLRMEQLLTPWTAFLMLGGAALTSSLLLLQRLQPAFSAGLRHVAFRSLLRDHWRYGRWAMATSVLHWTPLNIQLFLLGWWQGMAATASFKALINLLAPAKQIQQALTLLLLPPASQVASRPGWKEVIRTAPRIAAGMSAITLVYWVCLLLFTRRIFNFLYGGSYMEVSSLLSWVALASIVTAATYGPSIALRAMQLPSSVFAAHLASAAVAVLVGVPAVWWFGIPGAVFAFAVASIAAAGGATAILNKRSREGKPAPAASTVASDFA